MNNFKLSFMGGNMHTKREIRHFIILNVYYTLIFDGKFNRKILLNKFILPEKSSLSIAQISDSVGFPTPCYFAKSFKTEFGMLPSEFMTKARGKTGNEST